MKETEFQEAVNNLGVTEQSFVKERYYNEIISWAHLIDQVNSYADRIDDFGQNFKNELNNNIEDFNALLAQIKALNITEDPASPEHVRNRFNSFKDNTFQQLLSKKSLLESASVDLADIQKLKTIVSNAKRDAKNFEKSFQHSLQKQAAGSTKTLATYFGERLISLRNEDETNPKKWLIKRHFWGKWLAGAILVLTIIYIIGVNRYWFNEHGLQVAIVKLGILALLYSQYYFATKNYHIYADLVAYYEHMAIISKTLTDFIASAYDDDVLKENIVSNASKTLFSEVKTGHSKSENGDSPVLENIMNNWPRTGSTS